MKVVNESQFVLIHNIYNSDGRSDARWHVDSIKQFTNESNHWSLCICWLKSWKCILINVLTYIYIYAFSRRFYPKRLTIAFRLYIFISTCVPLESNPQPCNVLPLSHTGTLKLKAAVRKFCLFVDISVWNLQLQLFGKWSSLHGLCTGTGPEDESNVLRSMCLILYLGITDSNLRLGIWPK